MSKSRLEKFLYALYSLDSSDLPNPLSRIEELYKCLVTGDEAPTFEPLSRVEKYLMAILGGYDVELLPNPLSRVEVLLYKLATGDDNLDDFKSFLSEHEELLAEIIRNGGAGGNIDIEYVLYTLSTEFNTLYNTAEKPVKSAILKGQTLVNQSTTSELKFENVWQGKLIEGNALQSGKKYFASFDLESDNSELTIQARNGNSFVYHIHKGFTKGKNVLSFILEQDVNGLRFQVGSDFNVKISNIIILEYQDGMENWDIPYFKGMKSVKMPVLMTTGKNLFDGVLELGGLDTTSGLPNAVQTDRYRSVNYIKVKPNTSYTFSLNYNSTIGVREFDEGYGFFKWYSLAPNANTFTTSENAHFIRFIVINTYSDNQIQLEEGSVATEYEPYKTNILTVNEPVELRKVGNIQDELNLLTGELTQRVNEIVLDGSNDQFIEGLKETKGDYLKFGLQLKPAASFVHNIPLLSDNMNTETHATSKEGQQEQIYIHSHTATNTELRVCILPSKLQTQDANGFNLYLSENPITVQYPLASESVKTVDLSTVNQDGNDTKLSTFDDITHVTLSSEGLIPEAEMEVATKNEEVLNTMSLEMDDISKTQNGLQETLDTQSENVDSTMIATTEIYEGLL